MPGPLHNRISFFPWIAHLGKFETEAELRLRFPIPLDKHYLCHSRVAFPGHKYQGQKGICLQSAIHEDSEAGFQKTVLSFLSEILLSERTDGEGARK